MVEAEYKGHYLILTWSEYVNGTSPTTKAQDSQLEEFSNNLVSGTANIALSQRMVTGAPASPARRRNSQNPYPLLGSHASTLKVKT